jgi:hypothetical protein
MLEKTSRSSVEIGDALRKLVFRPMFVVGRDGTSLESTLSGADGLGMEGDWASR